MTADKPNNADDPAGLEFPCQYPVKAMGRSGTGFAETVINIVAGYVRTVPPEMVRTRDSKAGNYQSVTVTIEAESREHLESIYIALRAHEQVLWTL